MAEREIETWITMNGVHIPIYKGESKKDAVNRAIAKQNEDKKATDIARNKEEADKAGGKNEPKFYFKGKAVSKEEYQRLKSEQAKAETTEFLKSDKFKKAFEYAKGKIDKETYSWKETVMDAEYEYDLNGNEVKALEAKMKIYALQNGKFEKLHDEFREDFKKQGINIDNVLDAKEPLKQVHKAKDIVDELVKGPDYTQQTEYKLRSDWLREHSKEYEKNKREWLETIRQIDKGRDKYLDPEVVKAIGKREARILVNDKEHPELAELRQKADRLKDDMDQFEKRQSRYTDYFDRMDSENSKKQRQEYGRPEFESAVGEYHGFKTAETTVPYYDDLLKSGKAKVVEMTPEQYIHECAHYIFKDSTIQKVLRGRTEDEDTEKYAKMMGDGVKFDTPYLNYADGGQEGLHRAVAAYMNGIKKIPVVIIGSR